MPLTDTVREILTAAALKPSHTVLLPNRLPVAAQRVVVRSMLNAGLLEEVAAAENEPAWRTAEDGRGLSLRVIEAGLAAVSSPASNTTVTDRASPTPAVHAHVPIRVAAQALLAAWDGAGQPGLADAVQALRAVLAYQATVRSSAPRLLRSDTKRAGVLALLRRPEGATTTQLAELTGWARHTVHGFLSGLKKSRTDIAVLERVRQVGAGQETKGSYTVYGIGDAR